MALLFVFHSITKEKNKNTLSRPRAWVKNLVVSHFWIMLSSTSMVSKANRIWRATGYPHCSITFFLSVKVRLTCRDTSSPLHVS